MVRVAFAKDFAEAAIQSCLIHKRLTDVGQVLDSRPSMDEIVELSSVEAITIRVRTACSAAARQDVVGGYSVERGEAMHGDATGDRGASAGGRERRSRTSRNMKGTARRGSRRGPKKGCCDAPDTPMRKPL